MYRGVRYNERCCKNKIAHKQIFTLLDVSFKSMVTILA